MTRRIQTITSPTGEEMVVMSRADYDALIARVEDEDDDDVAIYDARKVEIERGDAVILPAEVSALVLKGKSRLAALRKWRGLTQIELATKAGLWQNQISAAEGGRAMSDDTAAKIAAALDVDVMWLR